MKQLFVFALLFVAACMPAQKEYTVIREQSRPAVETPVCPAQKPACPAMSAGKTPAYYAGTYTMQQPTVQFMVPAETMMPAPVMTAPVMANMIMAAPAPQMPAMNYTYQQPQMRVQQPPVSMPPQNTVMMQNTVQTTQTTQNNGIDTTVTEDSSVIILQHPTNRDLVKCAAADDQCVLSYQSQNYVQLKNAPHFAGHNDVPSDSDYPTRRWRENNDIPRW